MPTPNYHLPDSYLDGITPYDGDTIERLHLIVDSQLGAVLKTLGQGVLRYPDAGSFRVSAAGGLGVQVEPGLANAQKDGVFSLLELKAAITLTAETGRTELAPLYLFAAFYAGEDGRDDSFETLLPVFLWGDFPVMNGGVPLAKVTTVGGTAVVTDIRVLHGTAQLEADLGYDAAQRAKGTIAARLDALSSPADAGGDGPTAAQFNLLQALVNSLATRIETLEAKVAALVADATDDFPSFDEQMADEIAINRAGLAEVNPVAIERGQISVVVGNSGHGQFDTPDYSPTLHQPKELVFYEDAGVFGA